MSQDSYTTDPYDDRPIEEREFDAPDNYDDTQTSSATDAPDEIAEATVEEPIDEAYITAGMNATRRLSEEFGKGLARYTREKAHNWARAFQDSGVPANRWESILNFVIQQPRERPTFPPTLSEVLTMAHSLKSQAPRRASQAAYGISTGHHSLSGGGVNLPPQEGDEGSEDGASVPPSGQDGKKPIRRSRKSASSDEASGADGGEADNACHDEIWKGLVRQSAELAGRSGADEVELRAGETRVQAQERHLRETLHLDAKPSEDKEANEVSPAQQLQLRAEQCALSIPFQWPAQMPALIDKLKTAHFADPFHSLIWSGVLDLWSEGASVETVGLARHLQKNNALDRGTAAYVMNLRTRPEILPLLEGSERDVFAGSLIGSLDEARQKRDLEKGLGKVVIESRGAAPDTTRAAISKLALDAENGSDPEVKPYKTIGQSMGLFLEQMAEARAGGGVAGKIPTGFPSFDHFTGGLAQTDLVVIGGRPGTGKTSCMTEMVLRMSASGEGIVFFSLEMPPEQLGARVLSNITRLHQSQLRKAELDKDDMKDLIVKARDMAKRNIIIDATPAITLSQMNARLRVFKQMFEQQGTKMGAIFVDYIQIMGYDGRPESNVVKVSENSAGLKNLARIHEVPVIALAQVKRDVDYRENKRPMPSDFSGSSSIENEADIVGMLYRHQYYVEKGMAIPQVDIGQGGEMADERTCEFNIVKCRNGESGTIRFEFDAPCTRFYDPLDEGVGSFSA